jgi:tetratricopeptide (TPR) repeat protein
MTSRSVPALRVLSHQRIGLCLFYGGEPEQALHHLEKAIAYYDPTIHRPLAYVYGGDMGVHSRAYAAMAYFVAGRPDRARLYVRAALADAREGVHQHTIGFALSFCGLVLHMLGERQRVIELSEEGITEL